jgi:hypothetical protein
MYAVGFGLFSFGKGVYGFLTGCQVRALRVLRKIFLFPSFFGRAYFIAKKLDSPQPYTLIAYENKTPDPTDDA